MRRLVLGFIATLMAVVSLTAAQAATTSASATARCSVGNNWYAVGAQVPTPSGTYPSSCAIVGVNYTADHRQVRFSGYLYDTLTDGCNAGLSYRWLVGGVWGEWKGGFSSGAEYWVPVDAGWATMRAATSAVQVQGYRWCGGTTSAIGPQLTYGF